MRLRPPRYRNVSRTFDGKQGEIGPQVKGDPYRHISLMDLNDPYPSSAGMVPVRAGLRLFNVQINDGVFEDACESGQIPVRIERLGKNQKRFIRLAELDAWMRAQPATKPDADDPFK